MEKNNCLVPRMSWPQDIFDDIEYIFGPTGTRPRLLEHLKMFEGDDKYRMPMAYLKETDTEYFMNIEIPGVRKEDIKLNVKDGGLELVATVKNEETINDSKRSYYKNFRFYRTLPDNINKQEITSEYKDGLLEIRLPKMDYKKPDALEIKIN